MRATQAAVAIERAFAIRRPFMLWGPPGGGKSSLFKQFAARINVPVLDWRLTLMDPVDMRGTPREEKGFTVWSPPGELPRNGSKGILLLDELPQARIDTKNVAAMLVLERRIGEYRLPDGWWIAAAGNKMVHNAGTTPMPQHLNNRFWHCNLDVSVDDWLDWAEASDIDYRVYAYIKYRPQALLEFDPKSQDPSYPTPRSWELMSDIVKDLVEVTKAFPLGLMSLDAAVLAEMLAGAVGTVRGNEFAGFLRTMHSLVSMDEVFANPKDAPLPTDPAVCYALMVALAVAAKRDSLAAAAVYAERLPGEFSILLMHSVEKQNPSLVKSKAYIELCAKHAAQI